MVQKFRVLQGFHPNIGKNFAAFSPNCSRKPLLKIFVKETFVVYWKTTTALNVLYYGRFVAYGFIASNVVSYKCIVQGILPAIETSIECMLIELT